MRLYIAILFLTCSVNSFSQSIDFNTLLSFYKERDELAITRYLRANNYKIKYDVNDTTDWFFDSHAYYVYKGIKNAANRKAVKLSRYKDAIVTITYFVYDSVSIKKIVEELKNSDFVFENEDSSCVWFKKGDFNVGLNETEVSVNKKRLMRYGITFLNTNYYGSKSTIKRDIVDNVNEKVVDKYRAFDFFYTNHTDLESKKVDWVPVDLLIVVNHEKKKIKVYSEALQEYDLLTSTAKTKYSDKNDADEVLFNAVDSKGIECEVEIVKYRNPQKGHDITLVISYENYSYAYRIKRN